MPVGFWVFETLPLPRFHCHVITGPWVLSVNETVWPRHEFAYTKLALGFEVRITRIVSSSGLHKPLPLVVSTKMSVSLSPVAGVYVAFSVESFGLNVPDPLVVHTAPVGTVLMEPERLMVLIPPHKMVSAPALTVGAGVIVTTSESIAGVQEFTAFSVSTTLPALASLALGV